MGDLAATEQQIDALLQAATTEGLLDDQFMQLRMLQDETNPDFVSEVVQLYFDDSASKLDRLAAVLAADAPDFGEVDAVVHQLKGSSASFGAAGMAAACVALRGACRAADTPGCAAHLAALAQGFGRLRERLAEFLALEARRKALAGGGGGAP